MYITLIAPFVPHIFRGAPNSRNIGWLKKISRARSHRPLIYNYLSLSSFGLSRSSLSMMASTSISSTFIIDLIMKFTLIRCVLLDVLNSRSFQFPRLSELCFFLHPLTVYFLPIFAFLPLPIVERFSLLEQSFPETLFFSLDFVEFKVEYLLTFNQLGL